MTASFPDSALSSPPILMADKDKGDILRLRRLCLSNTIRANRKLRLMIQMAVHHLLARRRRLLYVCSQNKHTDTCYAFAIAKKCHSTCPSTPIVSSSKTEHLIQKKFPHVKHVYFVGEKNEPHILSSTAAILLSLHPRFLPASFLCGCHVA